MSPIEQQRSPLRALVIAALQVDADSPETTNQIDAALSDSLDDPWADIFSCVNPERSKKPALTSSGLNH